MLPNKLKRSSLYSFLSSFSPSPPSVLILPSISLSYQVICTRSLRKPSSAPSLSPQVIHLYSFSLLASMDKFISQNGENAVNKLHGKSHTPRKVGFCYYCQVFYPNGKQSTKLHKKTRTMKRSFSMTSGDRTKIFTLSLLGLSSKHNQYPSNQIQYSRNPKKKLLALSSNSFTTASTEETYCFVHLFFSYIFLYLNDQLVLFIYSHFRYKDLNCLSKRRERETRRERKMNIILHK